MRAYGYTGPAQLDKVLRWFRDEQNIHINPVYNNGVYHIQVIVNGNDIPFGRLKKACYYGAAWAGVVRAKFYINNHHRAESTKVVINEKLMCAS
jgi:hypothetical protein